MREGAWRPLWLFDVAAALESCPGDFDWNYCLREKRQAGPVVNAIGLAQRLLGVRIEGIPEALRLHKQPRWLIPTVLNEWGSTHTFDVQQARGADVATLAASGRCAQWITASLAQCS